MNLEQYVIILDIHQLLLLPFKWIVIDLTGKCVSGCPV